MSDTDTEDKPQPATIADLRKRIGRLSEASEATVVAGHLDLGDGIWLSTDPAGHARMTFQPAEDGFVLRLEDGDSGAWACLGMRFAPDQLLDARYLGLMVAQRAGDVVSFTPTLRYFRPEGLHDAPAQPVLMAGGSRENLSYLRVDPGILASTTGCEFNLFFHSDAFVAEFSRIEPLVMF